jgi:hypothetical protein
MSWKLTKNGQYRCSECGIILPLSERQSKGKVEHGCGATNNDYPPSPPGVGSHFAVLLRNWKITVSDSAGCGCESRLQQYNDWGPDECERRFEEIIDDLMALSDEVNVANIPMGWFTPERVSRATVRLLLHQAIDRARISLESIESPQPSQSQILGRA